MSSAPEIEVSDTARERDSKPEARAYWRARWQDDHELMYERLRLAISTDRIEKAHCPKCRGYVEIRGPDPRAITDAISKWHELAGLRPKPDDGAQAGAPPVRRVVAVADNWQDGGQPSNPLPKPD